MSESVLKEKSFDFALNIVKEYKILHDGGEYVMSKQLLRSGTSIGANIAEANMAQSVADFSAKMFIALKEASETRYWLQLLGKSGYMAQSDARFLENQCVELINMLVATTKKTSPRLHN